MIVRRQGQLQEFTLSTKNYPLRRYLNPVVDLIVPFTVSTDRFGCLLAQAGR
jgi:hypothetical protein